MSERSSSTESDGSGHGFTHLDARGRARMVDVSAKDPSRRRAVARCKVVMKAETVTALSQGSVAKGDVLAVARVAAIQAAKRTSDTIPLCHPIPITSITVDFRVEGDHVAVEAAVETLDRTGVEMEALHACSVAALTIYDMCKAIDREMVIADLALWHKSGGRSGDYDRSEQV